MKSLKFLSLLVFVLFSLTSIGQIKSGIVADFGSNDKVISHESNQAVVNLKILATDDQMKNIKAAAAKFSMHSTFVFSDTKDAQGFISITIKSKLHKDITADKHYLQKLMYDFNVERFVFKSIGYQIDKLSDII
ncbi:MAG: hypothetical protein A2X01_01375 [Bacteroidetes bacterium GWF2_35_48]|nr:MAG: hypothetical protein A2X01_01375 [Bacteroidetes bacterium GWF2_35_48]